VISSSLLTQTAAQYRRSDVLISGATFGFSKAVTRTDSQPVYVEVQTTGLTAGVTLSITGTLSGNNQAESLFVPLSGSGVRRSVNRWSTITQIAGSSSSGGSVTCRASFGSGQPAFAEDLINSALKVRIEEDSKPYWNETAPGPTIVSRLICYTNDLTVAPADILVSDGIRYEVVGGLPLWDQSGKHHAELELKRLG
jgi:hypothetical protein